MMRLSFEHFGKLQIIGTQLDITERMQMVKKTQELIAKRELAMKVSNIIHWDFDVRTQEFEAYNDPINDYASDKLGDPSNDTWMLFILKTVLHPMTPYSLCYQARNSPLTSLAVCKRSMMNPGNIVIS